MEGADRGTRPEIQSSAAGSSPPDIVPPRAPHEKPPLRSELLALARAGYGTWLRFVWPMLLMLRILSMALLTAGVLIQ
jgi:hypothetical protein